MVKKDWTGFEFGRLIVIAEAGSFQSQHGRRKLIYWLCKCRCGKEFKLVSHRVGITQSCGCLHNETTARINYKHGQANYKDGREYSSWQKIKARCYNLKNNRYHRYGGRGIRVCDRWLKSFENFLEDMGKMPSDNRYTIDRINNDGNYEPGNCRWATYKTQAITNTGTFKKQQDG